MIETEVTTKVNPLYYLILALFIYCIVAIIVLVISKCIIYKKNGTRWWYALIPVFNSYILFKMLWNTKHFFISLGISASLTIISRLIPQNNLLLFSLRSLLLIVVGIVLITYDILLYTKLARRYNKPDKFVYGMFFLPPVYFMILALSKTTTPIITEKSPVAQTTTTPSITENPQVAQTTTTPSITENPQVVQTTTTSNYNPSSYSGSKVDYLKRKLFVENSGLYDIIEKCYKRLGLISPNNIFNCDQNAVKNAVYETGIAMLLDLQKLTYEELSRIFEQGWRSVFDINLPNNGEEFDYMAGYLLNNYANEVQSILNEYHVAGV